MPIMLFRYCGPELRVKDFLGKKFIRGRVVFCQRPFLEHKLHRRRIGQCHIVERLTRAHFSDRSVHDLVGRFTPKVHLDTGFLLERR